MPNANNLTNYCKAITRHMHALHAVLPEISSQQDDEAAYTAMYHLRAIAECMDKARAAGSDDRGKDVLDAYEAVANAIRAAKEDT